MKLQRKRSGGGAITLFHGRWFHGFQVLRQLSVLQSPILRRRGTSLALAWLLACARMSQSNLQEAVGCEGRVRTRLKPYRTWCLVRLNRPFGHGVRLLHQAALLPTLLISLLLIQLRDRFESTRVQECSSCTILW